MGAPAQAAQPLLSKQSGECRMLDAGCWMLDSPSTPPERCLLNAYLIPINAYLIPINGVSDGD